MGNSFTIFLFIAFLCHCSSSMNVMLTVKEETKSIFEPFLKKEVLQLYQKQTEKKECSLKDGPNCYYISKSNNPSIIDNDYTVPPENRTISNHIQFYSEKIKDYLNQGNQRVKDLIENVYLGTFHLLLTFESSDEKTIKGDIYMEEERTIRFETGTMTVIFKGKLRLTFDKLHPTDKEDRDKYPSGTYGIIETDDLVITSNRKLSFLSYFARCSSKSKEKEKTIYVIGINNGKEEYKKVHKLICSKGWTRIEGEKNKKVDAIKFSGHIEVDNILIAQEYETKGSAITFELKDAENIIQKSVDKILEKISRGNLKNSEMMVIDLNEEEDDDDE